MLVKYKYVVIVGLFDYTLWLYNIYTKKNMLSQQGHNVSISCTIPSDMMPYGKLYFLADSNILSYFNKTLFSINADVVIALLSLLTYIWYVSLIYKQIYRL